MHYIYIYICVCISLYFYVYISIFLNLYIYIYTYTYIYIYIYRFVHIHVIAKDTHRTPETRDMTAMACSVAMFHRTSGGAHQRGVAGTSGEFGGGDGSFQWENVDLFYICIYIYIYYNTLW